MKNRIFVQTFVLAVVVVAEMIFFPQIAAVILHTWGARGGPGSGVIAFRDLYVIPGGLVFLALAALMAFRGKTLGVLIAIWVSDVLLVIAAVLVYRSMISTWE